ncbi:tRNA (adenosine(37)-N6)-threonylcarbamoyltransferase complex dimerization subunit type 1 TsaB [Candidatus Saccharibacteria bacterium RIFCSPHIGHO2_01_FULL_45_15]|nr:MAG: tRNA (adenosine(37)-N6)-threonylcarbamoyltransferase complex dimerization subunit type 1 TsaB [Candidatus Saccharibacteria bacterium RIFCSPHIGHO2_01_FULL_45_15]OGL27076.1 MAG: tRNA (adenosine(37)-N6)-threonylcarbamoyltransferase complex dimerization subunit type 1 TsaB [Candidatus Saccharibacteria bacterium RIFCSPHIGHO2_02_FULL_46_12]OGL32533.1 MAG: tRNA (adenosine(37)-N6)-threonylcarbamoyltransferase complex dimerization subunit type 1 TsaB [Candidatus Saccharibacteria bacterium RIFCSPHI
MILLLDTSTGLCRLSIVVDGSQVDAQWQADRQLAKGLLAYIQSQLHIHGMELSDCTGIGVFKGPGSFTGLRIGLTVVNTLADGLEVPIVGESGDTWQQKALRRLRDGHDDKIVLPDYGAVAHITKPRK